MIYLKAFKNKKPDNIRHVIRELYNCKAEYSDHLYKSVETYKDENCKSVECHELRLRSWDDIIEIVQTYFSDASEQEILKQVIETKVGTNSYFTPVNCPNILKPTVCYRDNIFIFISNDLETPFEFTNSRFKSWKEILSSMDISSLVELDKYVRNNAKDY